MCVIVNYELLNYILKFIFFNANKVKEHIWVCVN